ncbi:alcohol dehydrogenase [Arthrobacter sp. MYb227]|uniref:alcohol dehydrogenase n=1 Tax=Arthrobacter sp. MYb227 TaxID=1848601 RepID=UPI0021571849|nr:alcohol dehydrogenase [Arthrobacter sp. MYb227]
MRSFTAFAADRTIREIDSETPVPTGKEVLLRTTHSGVCHSDIHARDGYFDLGSRGKLSLASRGMGESFVMGHEVVGEVLAVGAEVTDRKIGDRVLLYPWLGCTECVQCVNGAENACGAPRSIGIQLPGGYADHVLVPHEKYLLDIEGLDPAWAATLACSGVTSFSAINKILPLPPEAPVAIIGAGGVGLSAVAILKALGHKNIIAIDLNPANLALATDAGATQTLQIDAESSAATIGKSLNARPAGIIDFVNNSQTAAIGFDWLNKGGIMVQVGLFGGELVIPTAMISMKMITIQGSFVGNLGELHQLVELAKSGQIPRSTPHSGSLSADGVRDALDALENRLISGRVVLESSN